MKYKIKKILIGSFSYESSTHSVICNPSDTHFINIMLKPINNKLINLNVNFINENNILDMLWIEQNGNFKSFNLLLKEDNILSHSTCITLKTLFSIKSIITAYENNRFSGLDFQSYIAIKSIRSEDHNVDISNLKLIKENSTSFVNRIIFDRFSIITNEIMDLITHTKYKLISFDNTNNTFSINALKQLLKLSEKYINNIEYYVSDYTKFQNIYLDISKHIKEDLSFFKKLMPENKAVTAFSLIISKVLLANNLIYNRVIGTFNNKFHIWHQVKIDNVWYNIDFISNLWNNPKINPNGLYLLKSDSFFNKYYLKDSSELEKCLHSFKKSDYLLIFIKSIKRSLFSKRNSLLRLPK